MEYISDLAPKHEASLKEIVILKAKIVELENLVKSLKAQTFEYENKIAMLSSEISRMKKLIENRQNSSEASGKQIEELETNKRILVDRVINIKKNLKLFIIYICKLLYKIWIFLKNFISWFSLFIQLSYIIFLIALISLRLLSLKLNI